METSNQSITSSLSKRVKTLVAAAAIGVSSLAPVSASALDFLNCNGPAAEFEDQLDLGFLFAWSTSDIEGNGHEWQSLAECGKDNFTGSTGEAMCVTPAIAGDPFNTTIESNEFTLAGADSAVLRFALNYQDIAAGGDILELEVKVNNGPWMLHDSWDHDVGVFDGPGVEVAVPLNMYLGEEDVKLRWRYLDSTAGADSGFYVQIDNIYLDCIGGADLQSGISAGVPVVIEGEEVELSYTYHNDGPKTATSTISMGAVPPAFNLLDAEISQGLLVPESGTHFMAFVGNIPSGDTVTATLRTRAGIAPEVALEVLSPNALAGDMEALGSTFGPQIDPENPIMGNVVMADDGAGTVNDGCEELQNADQMNGKIALLIASGSCSKDEQVFNAQKAGAVAAIVGSDSPGFAFLFFGLPDDSVMVPSGNVAEPITIPSIYVRYETAQVLKLNIVNNISAKIHGLPVLSQEQKGMSFIMGKEFDPDFTFMDFLGSNFTQEGVIVLADTDQDGTPDMNDECPKDASKLTPGGCGCGVSDIDTDGDGRLDCGDSCPVDGAKTEPGVCGCGVADVDANANGVMDCLIGPDLNQMISELKSLTQKMKKGKKGKKGKKAKSASQQQVKSLLAAIKSVVNASIDSIVLAGPDVNLSKLLGRADKSVKKAMRASGQKFGKSKKKAVRNIKRLQAGIAA